MGLLESANPTHPWFVATDVVKVVKKVAFSITELMEDVGYAYKKKGLVSSTNGKRQRVHLIDKHGLRALTANMGFNVLAWEVLQAYGSRPTPPTTQLKLDLEVPEPPPTETKELVPFQFKDQTINVIKDDAGNPWWVAKEVCEVLGFSKGRDAVAALDDDEKSTCPLQLDGWSHARTVSIINEPGLYSLILRSRKPEAHRFKRWVTHEVLPSIRKDGGYLHATPEMTDEEIMARAVLMGQKKIQALQGQIEALAPKAEAYDDVISTNGMTNLQQLGRIFGYKPNKLIGALRAIGWLSRKRRGGRWTNEPRRRTIRTGTPAAP